jgi:hypothetical protein
MTPPPHEAGARRLVADEKPELGRNAASAGDEDLGALLRDVAEDAFRLSPPALETNEGPIEPVPACLASLCHSPGCRPKLGWNAPPSFLRESWPAVFGDTKAITALAAGQCQPFEEIPIEPLSGSLMPAKSRLDAGAATHQTGRRGGHRQLCPEARVFKGRAGIFQTMIWILGVAAVSLLIAHWIRFS